MNICFYENSVGFRGTTRSICAYIRALSVISSSYNYYYAFDATQGTNVLKGALRVVESGAIVIPVANLEDLKKYNFDIIYYITSDSSDEFSSRLLNFAGGILIHHVGFARPIIIKNSLFAYVSPWQCHMFSGNEYHVLPHIIEQPPDIKPSREEARLTLGIPSDSIVLARHGGYDTWNLPFMPEVVARSLELNPNLFFLFLNTPKFISHRNVLFLPGTSNDKDREIFLSASDAMIHSRWEGETFGLSCAEFLVRNKPLITWAESRERNHFILADRSVITYNHSHDATNLLASLTHDYLAYKATLIPHGILSSKYSSEAVARKLGSLFCELAAKIFKT